MATLGDVQWPAEVHLPEPVITCIMGQLGVLNAYQSGFAGLCRLWRRLLWNHPDWESACDAMGLYHISRADGTQVHWGKYFLSWAQSEVTQLNIMRAVLRGENIFMTGEGGCGKTVLLDLIAQKLRDDGKKVYVTATTGLAATLIGGTTLHSWAGVGLAKGSDVGQLTRRMRGDLRKKWYEADVLIIDECSMLDSEYVEKLDGIGQALRRAHGRFFGGIQIILSGDFFQLPPVRPEGSYQFAFQMPQFERGIDHVFVLKHNHRSTDMLYTEILGRVRTGNHTAEDAEILKTRMNKSLDDGDAATRGVLPTRLHARRVDVQTFNNERLAELPGAVREWNAVASVRNRDAPGMHSAGSRYQMRFTTAQRQFESSCAVQPLMKYKNGAQVVLTINLSPAHGLVNGSRGVVVDAYSRDKAIVVQFANGELRDIRPHTWNQKEARGDHGEPIDFIYTQMPLALAWALTVHKSQGSTLDKATLDLGARIFEEAMAYVCLSRVPSLKAFSLLAFDPGVIRANASVRTYYAYIARHGTHKGFQESTSKIVFPTTQELYQLVDDLPQLKASRDAARAERDAREALKQEEENQRQDGQDAEALTRVLEVKRGADNESAASPEHKRQRV